MPRRAYNGVARDGAGKVVASATVYIYLADTTTAADVYTASSGGSSVNSVTTNTNGTFIFYVDSSDYNINQLFDLTISKANYQSQTIEDVALPLNLFDIVLTASLPAADSSLDGLVLIEDGGTGDRNLIVYAGGQRFRIDGGSAV